MVSPSTFAVFRFTTSSNFVGCSMGRSPGLLPRRILSTQRSNLPVRCLASHGIKAWKQVIARGDEGYVAKDEASPYEAGPTRRWLKVKQKDWTVADDRWQRRVSTAPTVVRRRRLTSE